MRTYVTFRIPTLNTLRTYFTLRKCDDAQKFSSPSVDSLKQSTSWEANSHSAS